MNSLLELINFGQSYWLDNLSRDIIKNGKLRQKVKEQGLRGVTSNPSIFNKAITNSSEYDEQIKTLSKDGKSVSEIYEHLVVKDVQDACDILQSVYEDSDGADGFVSLEVSPYLARHTKQTMVEARRLFQAVNRPNCLIKIPGTIEGIPAIEQMLYEGVNVNITLLFSIERYEAVAEAYIRALERRLNEGRDIEKIASVASFFVSRIDTLVDQLLGHRMIPGEDPSNFEIPSQLLGKIAVASGKIAYQSFKKIFNGKRWQKLLENNAHVQRLLWASTSTKNPEYKDVIYVEPFIGPNTVNTMPEDTISAFADHGKIIENSVEANLDEAYRNLQLLEKVGIALTRVTQQLEDEGIQKFIDPFAALMKNLADKHLLGIPV